MIFPPHVVGWELRGLRHPTQSHNQSQSNGESGDHAFGQWGAIQPAGIYLSDRGNLFSGFADDLQTADKGAFECFVLQKGVFIKLSHLSLQVTCLIQNMAQIING